METNHLDPSRHRPLRAIGVAVTFAVAVAAGALASPVVDAASASADRAASPSVSPGSPTGWTVERLSTTPSGGPAGGESFSPTISADGAHVAYATTAADLGTAPMPVAERRTVVQDLATGLVEHVSTAPEGTPFPVAGQADVNRDGSIIAMLEDAEYGHLIVNDRVATKITRNGLVFPAQTPAIDDAGDRVVYAEFTHSLEAPAENIWLYDASAMPAERMIARASTIWQVLGHPSISADGDTVAYDVLTESTFDAQLIDITDLDDIQVGTTIDGARLPDLDGAAQRVAYASVDADGSDRVFVRDLASGIDTLVADLDEGIFATAIVLSADGSTVAYGAAPAESAEFPSGDDARLVVADLATNVADMIATVGGGDLFDLSTDGRTVVFSSTDDTLVAGDGGGTSDVFIASRASRSAPTWPADADLTATDVGSSFVTLAWPAADDDLGVVNYRITVNGMIAAQLDSSARAHTVTGLAAATTYSFQVVAVDASGAESTPLSSITVTADAPDVPGTAALTLQAGPGGRVRLSWDPAGPDTSYVVSRAAGEGEFIAAGAVPAGTTTFVDESVAAATDYRYRIEAVDGATESHHSVERSVTTAALSIDTVTWQGKTRVDGSIDVSIHGADGWKAAVEVEYTTWYGDDGRLLEAPRTLTFTVPAAADLAAPGRYAATFALAEGIAQLTAIRGIISDGAGASVREEAAQLPAAVRGALHLDVEPPAGVALSGRVVVDGIAQRPLGEWTTWDLEDVAPGTHRIRVLDDGGNVMADTTVEVIDGRRTTAELAPRQLGLIAARLIDEAGAPVTEARVAATLVSTGVALGTVTSDRSGNVQIPGSLFVGDEVDLEITPRAGTELIATVATLTAVATDERIAVTVSSNRTGVLEGRITLDGDIPAAGARVVISQTGNGNSRAFRAVADDDGRYTVRGYAGPATVVVSYRQDPTASMGTVVLGDEPTTGDFSLAIAGTYRIVTSLSTRTMDDASWVPVDINPLNAWHFRLLLEAGRTKSAIVATDTVIRAVPGDVITICADGMEFGMGDACETVTLGDAPVIPVDLRVAAVGRVRFAVVNSDGTPLHPDLQKRVSLLRRVAGGRYENMAFEFGTQSAFDIDLADTGHYRLAIGTYAPPLRVSTLAEGPPTGTGRTVEFDVVEGQVVDLGAIALGTSRFATRSDVTVVRPLVPVGGVAEVRAALRPDVPGTHTAMTARLTIPAGTSIVAGSVTVDGAQMDTTTDGDNAVVNIGDRTFAADDEVVVRYRLTTDGVEPGSGFNAFVNVRSTIDGTTVTGLAGSPTINVAGVSIDGPARSATNTVVLSGLAPANTVVRVTEARQELGRTTSSTGGRWRLTVTLPDFGPGETHPVVASVTLQDDAGYDQIVSSRAVGITVDPRYPELVGVSLVQRNGTTDGAMVDIDPRDGVAHVPYVFRGDPGTLSIETQFAGRGEVTSVDVSVGSVHAGGSEQIGDDRFRSMVTVNNTQLGGVYATFEADPDIATLDDVPVFTEEEVREQLPVEFADAPLPDDITVEVDEAANTRTAHMSPALPGLTGSTATISVTRGLLYTPTPSDLEIARSTGVPAYGGTFEVDRVGDEMVVTGSIMIPESALEEGTFGPDLNVFGLVRVGYQVAFNYGTAGEAILGSATAGGKYDRLSEMMDWANKNCEGNALANVKSELERLANLAIGTDVAKMVLTVAGVGMAVGTFGIGTVAVWAVGFFVDKAIDYLINQRIDEANTYMRDKCEEEEEDPYEDWPDENQPDPNNRPPTPPTPALIDPVWIHDPSGFVYEGVPSNRIVGATATLTYSATPDGPFDVWDAEWFGQSNPMPTDGTGAYGWDVPEGFWQVVYTKDGYDTTRSDVLEVLPPHFDVNVGMDRIASPIVAHADANSGASRGSSVTVTFDNYMRLDAADRITVSDADGHPVEGTFVAVDGEDGPLGRFATTFRLDTELVLHGDVTLAVDSFASDHDGRPMTADWSRSVAVVLDDTEAPTASASASPLPNAAGWNRGPVTVSVRADDAGSGVGSIDWTAEGATTGSGSVAGADTASGAAVDVVADGTTTVRYSATDVVGNVSERAETVVRIDSVGPTLSIASPAASTRVVVGAIVEARFTCADGGSGIASCFGGLTNGTVVISGSPIPTGVAGTQTLRVVATDTAGNETTSTVSYEVMAPPPPPAPHPTKASIPLIDAQLTALHSLKISAVREAGLAVPLALARVAASIGARGAACQAIDFYEQLVASYTSKRWITAAQSVALLSGAAGIDKVLAC